MLGVHAVGAFAVPMVANLMHHNVGVWTHDDEAFKVCVDEVARNIGRVHEVVTTDSKQGFDGVAELVEQVVNIR